MSRLTLSLQMQVGSTFHQAEDKAGFGNLRSAIRQHLSARQRNSVLILPRLHGATIRSVLRLGRLVFLGWGRVLLLRALVVIDWGNKGVMRRLIIIAWRAEVFIRCLVSGNDRPENSVSHRSVIIRHRGKRGTQTEGGIVRRIIEDGKNEGGRS